jgi:transcriptional regulator GlxA family with amidase domain
MEYLQTTQMSVDDVAWKVGFSDSANLRRAVRRWTNGTVGQIRAGKVQGAGR